MNTPTIRPAPGRPRPRPRPRPAPLSCPGCGGGYRLDPVFGLVCVTCTRFRPAR